MSGFWTMKISAIKWTTQLITYAKERANTLAIIVMRLLVTNISPTNLSFSFRRLFEALFCFKKFIFVWYLVAKVFCCEGWFGWKKFSWWPNNFLKCAGASSHGVAILSLQNVALCKKCAIYWRTGCAISSARIVLYKRSNLQVIKGAVLVSYRQRLRDFEI